MAKYKVGDKVRIIGNASRHSFRIGEIVTLADIVGSSNFYKNRCGVLQFAFDSDVTPYKEKSK